MRPGLAARCMLVLQKLSPLLLSALKSKGKSTCMVDSRYIASRFWDKRSCGLAISSWSERPASVLIIPFSYLLSRVSTVEAAILELEVVVQVKPCVILVLFVIYALSLSHKSVVHNIQFALVGLYQHQSSLERI